MNYRMVNILISFFIMLLFVFSFFKRSDDITYKCQATLNKTILHSNIYLDAYITKIYNKNSSHIPYTVVGTIKKGGDTYILFRDGDVLISKNKIMRKRVTENIIPLDNVADDLWEDNFLIRKHNVAYYQSDIEIGEQLVFIKDPSGPIMVCVKSLM